MHLSKRLEAIANQIQAETIIDVGTDHAYIPIFVVSKNIAKYAYAFDISKGSLEKAKKNIRQYGLESKIETKLCNGLLGITAQEAQNACAVISGMGGMLIIEILQNSPEIVLGLNQLILSPQLNVCEVRKYIHSINFKIKEENLVFEDGIYYNVINCCKGTDVEYNEADYAFGKLTKKHELFKDYVKLQLEKHIAIKNSIENAGIKNNRLDEINNIVKILENLC